MISQGWNPYRGTERRAGSNRPRNPAFFTSVNGTSWYVSTRDDAFDVSYNRCHHCHCTFEPNDPPKEILPLQLLSQMIVVIEFTY